MAGNRTLKIRTASADEFDAVGKVIQAAYREYKAHYPPEWWERYEQSQADVQSRAHESELVVAELDGRIIGSITLYLDGYRGGAGSWPEGWAGIRLVSVHPDARGLGVAKAMMNECLEMCRARGIPVVGLHTTQVMATARGMYERMGFERVPQFDHHPRPDYVVYAYKYDL